MFGALKRGFRSMAGLILVSNVVGELRQKRTLAASRGFLAAARLSCFTYKLTPCKYDIQCYQVPVVSNSDRHCHCVASI